MGIDRKPEWLRKKVNPAEQDDMRRLLDELGLNTVCRQALCPNISECFSRGEVTFLILGKSCTRRCSFCNIDKELRPSQPDQDEPGRVGQAVSRLGLSHVVITSPTRDDLADGGSAHFAATVAGIRAAAPKTYIELLIPDFMGNRDALQAVVTAGPDVLAHNLETVPRLYSVRAGADYMRSLEVLRQTGMLNRKLNIKSGIMLGLGERDGEVECLLGDLLEVGCRLLSVGQYLAPSRRHEPVKEFVPPHRFEFLADLARKMGFRHVESGPYVRSSYHAGLYCRK